MPKNGEVVKTETSKRPIDVSVGRTYTDFRSRFAVVSKLRANIWLTTALVLFVIGFMIGVAYIVDPQSFFFFDKIQSQASRAAEQGNDLQAILSLNTCVRNASAASTKWFFTSSTKKGADQQAGDCAKQRADVIAKNPTILGTFGVSLAGVKVSQSAAPFIETQITSASPLSGIVSGLDSSTAQTSSSVKSFLVSQSSGQTALVYTTTPVQGSTNVTFVSGYKLAIPNSSGITTPVYVATQTSSGTTPQPQITTQTVTSGTVKLAIVPVTFKGQASTVDFTSIANQIASYMNGQAGGKMTMTANVLPAVDGGTPSSYCLPPPGAQPSGYTYVIFAINSGCGTDTGTTELGGAGVNAGATVATYIHELGHLMGLGHQGGGNPTGDPMDIAGLATAGSFNVVHKDLLNWAATTTVSKDGNYGFGGVQALVIPGGCPQNSAAFKSSNSLYVDSSMRVFCWYPWDKVNSVDAEYKGTVTATGFIGANVTLTLANGQVAVKFTASANPTPPTNPGTGACSGSGCGNPVTVGKLGPVSLVCVADGVSAAAGSSARVQLSATGDSRISMMASVPTRLGPLGPNDQGTRAAPVAGFRPGDPSLVTLVPGSFASLPISIDPTVAPGTYTVNIEGYTITYITQNLPPHLDPKTGQMVDPDGPGGEPALIGLYTTCGVPITVTAASSPTGGSSAFLYVNGHRDDAGDLIVRPGDRVSVTWNSTNVVTCKAYNGTQLLGMRQYMEDTSAISVSITQDTTIRLVCTGGDPDPVVKSILVHAGAPDSSGHGPGGLIADVEVGSMQHVDVSCPSNPTAVGCQPFDTVVYGKTAQVAVGQTAYVRWTSTNSSSCSISPLSVTGLSGSTTITNISAPVSLKLTCTNPSGSATDTAQITVTGFSGGPGGQLNTLVCTPSLVSADILTASSSASVNVRYSGTSGALTLSGSFTAWPTFSGDHTRVHSASIASGPGSTQLVIDFLKVTSQGGKLPTGDNFVLNATDSSGQIVGSCTITVNYLQVSSVDLTATPSSVSTKVGDADVTVTLAGGVAPYVLQSYWGQDSSVATASLSGTTLTIHAVGPGHTQAFITDSDSSLPTGPRSRPIPIDVVATGGGGGGGGGGTTPPGASCASGSDSGAINFTLCPSGSVTGDFDVTASATGIPSGGFMKIRVDGVLLSPGNCDPGDSCTRHVSGVSSWAAGSSHTISVTAKGTGAGDIGGFSTAVNKPGTSASSTGGGAIPAASVTAQSCAWYDLACLLGF